MLEYGVGTAAIKNLRRALHVPSTYLDSHFENYAEKSMSEVRIWFIGFLNLVGNLIKRFQTRLNKVLYFPEFFLKKKRYWLFLRVKCTFAFSFSTPPISIGIGIERRLVTYFTLLPGLEAADTIPNEGEASKEQVNLSDRISLTHGPFTLNLSLSFFTLFFTWWWWLNLIA